MLMVAVAGPSWLRDVTRQSLADCSLITEHHVDDDIEIANVHLAVA
jgi:hypothetical protein